MNFRNKPLIFNYLRIISLFTLKISGISVAVIGLLFIVFWFELLEEEIPNLISPKNGLSFDYIIVGAGTAGIVLATEMNKKNPNATILLVEAGHTKFGVLSKIPLLTTMVQMTEVDWGFLSTPQKYSSYGLKERRQYLARGKGLGGSSRINYMLHYDGSRRDFDEWEKLGATNWSYDNMRKYLTIFGDSFQQCIKCIKSDTIWKIPRNYSKLSEAFEESKLEFSKHNLSFRLGEYNVKNGLRHSVYETHFLPQIYTEEAKNFYILTGAFVQRINVKNLKAISISTSVVNKDDDRGSLKEKTISIISARKEIILSAGAFQTPHLLQISGIGPSKLLKHIGIKKVFDSPNVGKNLYDHVNLPLYVSISESASINADKILNIKEILTYLLYGEGHFSNFGVIGHIVSRNDTFGINIFGVGAIDETALMSLSNFKRESFRSLFPLYYNQSQEGFVLLITCLDTFSRGTVEAKSSYPEEYPNINVNYLSNDKDINCLIRGIRKGIEIITTSKSFELLKPKIHWPKMKNCLRYLSDSNSASHGQPSDQYLECLIRNVGLTSHHPGGTCKMSDHEGGVVDSKLKVKGISSLRIVDSSILPAPVFGTPNFIITAVAKRAANLILPEF